MAKYIVEPINEPDGEGNGWDCCSETEATCFRVIDTFLDEVAETFDTSVQAQKFISENA